MRVPLCRTLVVLLFTPFVCAGCGGGRVLDDGARARPGPVATRGADDAFGDRPVDKVGDAYDTACKAMEGVPDDQQGTNLFKGACGD